MKAYRASEGTASLTLNLS